MSLDNPELNGETRVPKGLPYGKLSSNEYNQLRGMILAIDRSTFEILDHAESMEILERKMGDRSRQSWSPMGGPPGRDVLMSSEELDEGRKRRREIYLPCPGRLRQARNPIMG